MATWKTQENGSECADYQDTLNVPQEFQRPDPTNCNPAYVPIICTRHLKGNCDKEKTKCRKYHINYRWAWQLKGNHGRWFSFPINDGKKIEKAYTDDSATQLKLLQMPTSLWGMLGSGACRVFFKEMMIKGSRGSGTYDIHRICTPSSVKVSDEYATDFKWCMFMPNTQKGNKNVSWSWEQIIEHTKVEKEYLQNSYSHVTISHKGSKFDIDFVKMCGKNIDTGKEVTIRRRPKKGQKAKIRADEKVPNILYLSSPQATSANSTSKPKKKADSKESNSLVPQSMKGSKSKENSKILSILPFSLLEASNGNKDPNADDVQDSNTDNSRDTLLVPLKPKSRKALQIKEIMLSTLPNANNINIAEVRNSDLSRPFKNKITELVRRQQKDPTVLRLLHCPRPDQVDKICRENFSPDLQMPSIPQKYGKGTYFFKSTAEAAKWCPEDAPECVLMLADVYIGDSTQGNPTLSCPPKKPASGSTVNESDTGNGSPDNGGHRLPGLSIKKSHDDGRETFDTLVDNTTAPQVVVKFSKRDICPKFVITFTL